MAKAADIDVREATLTSARMAVQKGGYNALSFRDIAAEIGVKSSSIHYHFPTKGDLAEALMARINADFEKRMEAYSDKPFDEAMDAYLELFKIAFDGSDRLCPGAMMSAEVSALPPAACKQIESFVKKHTDWLSSLLAKTHKRMSKDQRDARARAIFAALEGAMLMTRGQRGDQAAFDEIIETYKTSGLLA